MIQRAERLDGVHPDLIQVVIKAGVFTDFIVTCGMRTHAEQVKLFAEGKTRTMNSRHLHGMAVDLAVLEGGKVTWEFDAYRKLNDVMQNAAAVLGVPITWGGSWRTFKDGPHFELPHAEYPDRADIRPA
jgi:peptidoglycan L-alanyl-D-glutamate endopeptidase CwlK